MYLFGQDFTYKFTPFLDNETISSIPAQTATLYLFDSRPSESQALIGTSAIQTVNGTWTAGASACDFSVDGVDDPDQDSNDPEVDYYVSVVFKLSTGEQSQFSVRTITFSRVVGNDKVLNITSADLASVYPLVTTYASANDITNQITYALSWLKRKLKGKGYEYALIHNLPELKLVLVYRSLAQIMVSQIRSGNSQFETIYRDYKETYTDLLGSFAVEYDSDNDGEADIVEDAPSFQIVPR